MMRRGSSRNNEYRKLRDEIAYSMLRKSLKLGWLSRVYPNIPLNRSATNGSLGSAIFRAKPGKK